MTRLLAARRPATALGVCRVAVGLAALARGLKSDRDLYLLSFDPDVVPARVFDWVPAMDAAWQVALFAALWIVPAVGLTLGYRARVCAAVVLVVAVAQQAFDRVGHVHLKDVNLSLVPPVLAREKSLMAATQEGLFTPLGQGDVDIAGVVEALESRGYDGWYVIEQDTALTDGLPADGEGPIEQVITSMDFLRTVVAPRVSA